MLSGTLPDPPASRVQWRPGLGRAPAGGCCAELLLAWVREQGCLGQGAGLLGQYSELRPWEGLLVTGVWLALALIAWCPLSVADCLISREGQAPRAWLSEALSLTK